MFVLPSYFISDISIIEEKLNALAFPTEFLIPDLEVVKVFWEGQPDEPAGEFRYDIDYKRYIFWAAEDTLKGLTEGHS